MSWHGPPPLDPALQPGFVRSIHEESYAVKVAEGKTYYMAEALVDTVPRAKTKILEHFLWAKIWNIKNMSLCLLCKTG